MITCLDCGAWVRDYDPEGDACAVTGDEHRTEPEEH